MARGDQILEAPNGLADSLSPVDLPPPPAPLPRPLRWTTIAIATASLVLALFNAAAIRGWSYELEASDQTARIVAAAEAWHGVTEKLGLNRPVEAMHAGWQSAKDVRFGGEPATPPAPRSP